MSSYNRNLLKKLGLPIACVAMFFVVGGHWAVIQSVAWTQMLWTYALESDSIVDAVEKTFDGQHPCKLCVGIAKTQKDQGKNPILAAAKKVEAFAATFQHRLVEPRCNTFSYPAAADSRVLPRSDQPDVPVPIAA